MSEKNKNILMIAYYFPPNVEIGGLRIAKFCRYLPDLGWTPFVITIKPHLIEKHDESRMNDVGDTVVVRTSSWKNMLDRLVDFKNSFRKKTTTNYEDESKSSIKSKKNVDIVSTKNEGAQNNNKQSVFKRCIESFFATPDYMRGWFIPAVIAGYRIIKNENVDVILASGPPVTGNVIGVFLSKITGVPLVTDLRDPFALHEEKESTVRTGISDAFERWLEKRIIYNSSLVITTNDRYTNVLKSRFPDISPDRFCTVWNGYDSSDFPDLTSNAVKNKKFTIIYPGSFYLSRTPLYFLQGLKKFILDNNIYQTDIQVDFIGSVEYAENVPVKEMARGEGLENCVNVIGTVPYDEALKRMLNSDVLLLFAPEYMVNAVPAKTFEYLYARKNILCLTADGATSDFLNKIGGGLVVDPFNVNKISSAIYSLYQAWVQEDSKYCAINIERFERKSQTESLSGYLNQIIDASR